MELLISLLRNCMQLIIKFSHPKSRCVGTSFERDPLVGSILVIDYVLEATIKSLHFGWLLTGGLTSCYYDCCGNKDDKLLSYFYFHTDIVLYT